MAVKLQSDRFVRAEDLERPGAPEKFVEIIVGELIEMSPAGYEHNTAAHRIQRLFEDFCEGREGLKYGLDNDGFLLKRDPDSLLSPDASLFRVRPRASKLWLEFAPEVAVEVISPSNTQSEIALKRNLFFEAGTEQFWAVDPGKKHITIYHRDGRVLLAQGSELVKCEGILEGLNFNLEDVFRER